MTTTDTFADRHFIGDKAGSIASPLRFEGVAQYDAGPNVLFAAVSEPDGLRKWLPMLKSLHMDHSASGNGPKACGVGSERSCSFNMMGKVIEKVVSWDPPKSYTFSFEPQGRMKLMTPTRDMFTSFTVDGDGKGGSIFTFRVYFKWRGVFMRRLSALIMPAMLNMGLENLRRQFGGKGGRMRAVA